MFFGIFFEKEKEYIQKEANDKVKRIFMQRLQNEGFQVVARDAFPYDEIIITW